MNDHMSGRAFAGLLHGSFYMALRHCEEGAAAYVFHADSNGLVFREQFHEAGWNLRQVLVWVKNHFNLGRMDYHYRHEPVLYGVVPGASHYFTDNRTQCTVFDDSAAPDYSKLKRCELVDLLKLRDAHGRDCPQSVLYFDKPLVSAEHPTMKPVPLLGKLIKNSSKPGWIVLDSFAGSGSTLIACEELGRHARCMELDPRYSDVIIARWEAHTGQKAERINAG